MSYEKEPAITVSQDGRKTVQSILQDPILVGGGLLLIIGYANIWAAVTLVIGGVVVWKMSEAKRIANEAAARAASYRNICCPQVICSEHPNESVHSVSQRAEAFRKELQASGNLYAAQIPVIAYPFTPMISDDGTLFTAWDRYRRECGAFLHAKTMEWVDGDCPQQLRAIVLNQVIQRPQPVSENEI